MMPRLTAVVTARVTLEAVDMLLLTVLGLLSPVSPVWTPSLFHNTSSSQLR